MQILMKQTRHATLDGVRIQCYKTGAKVEVPDFLASIFISAGFAIPAGSPLINESSMILALPALVLAVPPATEPLTLAETKAYLRVDSSADDTLINRLITGARQAAELYLKASLITQSWQLSYDDYAPSEITLRRLPVQSITHVKTYTRDMTPSVLSAANYTLNAAKDILRIDQILVAHRVEVQYVAGFGDASAVPAPIKQGMLTHIAAMYDNRAESLEMPNSARALYDFYRMVAL